jgi:hypothetical protein
VHQGRCWSPVGLAEEHCHRNMTSRKNSGQSMDFDNNMAVVECSAIWGECGSFGEGVW